MKKSLLFVALLLTLLVSACNQAPLEIVEAGLEPQFGTGENDYGIDVVMASTGRIYVLSEESGPVYEEYNGSYYRTSEYQKTLLRRYDGSGNLTWVRELFYNECDNYECTRIDPVAAYTDADGYIYVLYRHYFTGEEDAYPAFTGYSLTKYGPAGYYIWSRTLGNAEPSWPNVDQVAVDITLDNAGNVYVALAEEATGWSDQNSLNLVAKYSTNGTLLWQRTSTVGIPRGITVSSTGNVYVVGTKGVARYTNSGNLSWTKSGSGDDIIISGSNLYVRAKTTIRKYDSNGKQLWSKAQSGLSGMVIADMVGDGSGNVYLTGKFSKTSSNRDAFARKLSASGSTLWTQQFGTSAYDDARGIATLNGPEIYVTGSTQGSLSHPNIGGSDGYLRKMNSSGSRVWTR